MTIQEWFDKRKEAQIERRAKEMRGIEDANPGLWVKCVHCDSQILKTELEDNLMVCPHCDYHFRINARTRISQLFDKDSFEELFKGVRPTDPLNFVDTESYADRLKKAHDKTGLDEAVITGLAKIEGHKIAVAVMDFDYMGGSMGSVVGEKVTMADLKGTLTTLASKIFGDKLAVRFRPSFFPFTEPSVEVDVTCFKCGGKGCPLCKQTGWIEVLGAGMVHPNVLEMSGYDSTKYQGFAFGTGMDRFAMFKYGITDIRTIYGNDIRFLTQFDRKDVE